ncbi:MAG TPA: DUF4105 domain-containing protein [Nevskiaceae bacterium]
MTRWWYVGAFLALMSILAGACAASAATDAPPAVLPADTPTPLGSELQVSLLTFGPGRVYWERFGHDAILIRNLQTGVAVAYNYGIFDFSQKHFFLNFALGHMQYRMAADPFMDDLDFYAEHGRSVTQQVLNLTPAQRLSLARFLEWNIEPQNTRYRYDYFLSNCSTRVRDALDRVLGGAIQRQLSAVPALPGHTYRFDAVRALSPDAWLAGVMDVALGPAADRPLNLWKESFLPEVLRQSLERVTVRSADGREVPLVADTRVLVHGSVGAIPAAPPRWTLPLLAIGIAWAVVLVLLVSFGGRTAHLAFAALATATVVGVGAAGIVLALIWGITAHWAGWHNENLLLFDPLCLLLIPLWWRSHRSSPRASQTLRTLSVVMFAAAVASLVVRVLPGATQENLPWIALLLPIHVALLLVVWRRLRLRTGSASTPRTT